MKIFFITLIVILGIVGILYIIEEHDFEQYQIHIFFYCIGTILLLWGGVLIVVRLYQYFFGMHQEKIYFPQTGLILSCVGIFVPGINIIVFIYILFVCKSVKRLLAARNRIVRSITPSEVVEATEKLILDNRKLLTNQWVVETWSKTNKSEWIKRLTENEPFLRTALSKKVKVHVSLMLPLALPDFVG